MATELNQNMEMHYDIKTPMLKLLQFHKASSYLKISSNKCSQKLHY